MASPLIQNKIQSSYWSTRPFMKLSLFLWFSLPVFSFWLTVSQPNRTSYRSWILQNFTLTLLSAWTLLPTYFYVSCSFIYWSVCSNVTLSEKLWNSHPISITLYSLPCLIFLHSSLHYLEYYIFKICVSLFVILFSQVHRLCLYYLLL